MWQNIPLCVGIALEAGILAGIVVRRRVRAVVLLPVWLLAHMGLAVAHLLRPSLNTWEFWNAKELALFALTALMGLEVGARLGGVLPGVRRHLTLGVAVNGVCLAGMLHGTPDTPFATQVLPAVAVSTAALYIWIYVTAFKLFLPLDPLHRVLLVGMPVTSLLYATSWHGVLDDASVAGYVNAYAFMALLAVLLRTAWRRDAPGMPELVRQFLWTWRG